MAAQGYLRANQRASCGNCMHGQERTETLAPRWWCALGGFWVSALAACDKHVPRQPWMDE